MAYSSLGPLAQGFGFAPTGTHGWTGIKSHQKQNGT